MGHIIVCGLGHVGFRTFDLLHRMGARVVVVGQNSSPEWRSIVEAAGATYFEGDARDEALLLRAGLATARAVIAVTDQDLVNLSVAMDTRRHAPQARLIVRLFDVDLGRHVADTLRIDRVLSTTALASPVFASSALGHDPLGLLTWRGTTWALSEAGAPDPGEVALWSTGGHGLVLEPIVAKVHARSSRVTERLWALPRTFRVLLATLVAVIGASALVIHKLLDLPYIDAVYFTVTTLTTVGYGDFNFATASVTAKLFGCLLMLVGATLMSLLFSAMTDLVLSEKLSAVLGGRPVPAGGHTIVVGAGHIGARVVELLLAAGAEPVVVENDRVGRHTADVRRAVAAVQGDARSPETLGQAHLGTARALVAVTDDDVENLGVALAARRLNPAVRTAVRTFDVDLGARLQGQLGLDRVLSVSAVAAPYFAGAVTDPSLVLAIAWRGHLVLVSEVEVPGSAAVAMPGGRLFVHVTPLVDPSDGAGLGGMHQGPDDAA